MKLRYKQLPSAEVIKEDKAVTCFNSTIVVDTMEIDPLGTLTITIPATIKDGEILKIWNAGDLSVTSLTVQAVTNMFGGGTTDTIVYADDTIKYIELVYYDGLITPNVVKLGTTNIAGFTGVISDSWENGNTYPSGTIIVKDGFIYQANALIPANTGFITGETGATWKALNIQTAEYGEINIGDTIGTAAGVTTDLNSGFFTLPSAGTWEVSYNVHTRAVVPGAWSEITLTDISNNTVPNSLCTGSFLTGGTTSYNDFQTTASNTVRITTTESKLYKLRIKAVAGVCDVYAPGSKLTWKKIAGFVPLQIPQSNPTLRKDITYVSKSGSNAMAVVANGLLYTACGGTTALGNWAAGRGGSGVTPFFGLDNFKEVIFPAEGTIAKVGGFNESVSYILYTNGDLYTWGRNVNGQCGVGNTSVVGLPTLAATNVIDVYDHPSNNSYSGANSRLFIKKLDGYIYATGYNAQGALGLGDTTNRTTFTKITSLGTNVKSLWNMGAFTGCVVVQKTDNTLWVAGYNGSGPLGNGNTTNKSSFIQVNTQWASTDWNLTKVIGQSSFYDASESNHAVLGMLFTHVSNGTTLFKISGENAWGALADGTTTDRSTPVTPNVGSGVISDIAMNGGGGASGVSVLKANGDLYSWGYNSYGLVGDGTTTSKLSPVLVQTQVLKILNDGVTGYTYGYRVQNAILKADGVYMCGSNGWGSCGNGTSADALVYTRVLLPRRFNLKHLGCYTSNASVMTYVAVGEDNSMYCWGYAGYNALVSSSTIEALIPAQFKIQD